MAKKDNDNFDFETESEGKGKFDLVGFFKNLTKQQKGIILAAVVGMVVVIAIVVTCLVLGANGGMGSGSNNGDNTSGEKEAPIIKIYISAMPTTLTYSVGDSPNYSGMKIAIDRGISGTKYISYEELGEDLIITGFDSSAPSEEQVITVDYKGFTDTYTVTIKEMTKPDPVLVGIEMGTLPKTEITVGKPISIKNGTIICTYDDGSTVEIGLKFEYISDLPDNTVPGEYTIRVIYGEKGVYKETSYTLVIKEAE